MPCPPTNSGGIDGSCWTVGQATASTVHLGANQYGLDDIGLTYNAPAAYQGGGSTFPCSIVATQRMYINCPWNPVLYTSNLLEVSVGGPQVNPPVIVTRAGISSQGNPPPP
jgi:hypothetical protein